ncbi:MAG: cytochrome P450 [Acidobacteriia bacterium]|nr:cytochrome P450 [Terriglobia bacterium]
MPAVLRRPPGPAPRFLIGNLPLFNSDPLAIYTRWAREFGDIFYYRAAWMDVYFLNHPSLIEAVLVSQSQHFAKDKVIQNSRWFLGEGLLTSEGSGWLRQRRLSQPAFHRERMAAYGRTMAAYAEEMLATWQDADLRDIHPEMIQLTMRIVAKVLFSVEVKADTERVAGALNILMRHTSGGRMILPPVLRHVPVPAMMRVKRAVHELDEIVNRIIRQRRASGEDTGDLLSMLMAARDEDGSGMTDRQLRDEILTFLLAGHETTAVSLSWTWYLLSQHPDVEQKLHQELRQVLDGRTPQLEDLPRLPYADKVVKESMRLYPPAWSLARTVTKEIDLAGYCLPVGANVVMSPWILHRDPRFFEQPEQFNPERWTAETAQRLPRFAYFPFGGGPRLCIGASFAIMEAHLLLATIAQRFQLRLLPGHPVDALPSITLRPRHGMRMSLSKSVTKN